MKTWELSCMGEGRADVAGICLVLRTVACRVSCGERPECAWPRTG